MPSGGHWKALWFVPGTAGTAHKYRATEPGSLESPKASGFCPFGADNPKG